MSSRLLRLVGAAVLALSALAANAESRMTRFDPATHGFRFANTFNNDVVRELDIRTNGLCGGMVYSALDYFNAGQPIPRQAHRPATNTPLHDYIYDRQVTSITENADKWAEVGFNPFGARNSEFFRWGLQGFGGGRLEELRARIDRGQPAPLGLWHKDGHPGGDHQVLAIGYDLGRYRGDLGAHQGDLRIFVYDPNFPGRTMTLVPDTAREGWRYLENGHMWQTYFVDAKYRSRRPTVADAAPARAASPDDVVELLVTIETGGDDLRGGNDNVDVVLHTRGTPRTWRNANGGRRWIGNYSQTLALPVRGLKLADLRAIELVTAFGGGIGGDNWNVDCVMVQAVTADGAIELVERRGRPLVRFTGELHRHRIDFPAAVAAARVVPLKLPANLVRLPATR